MGIIVPIILALVIHATVTRQTFQLMRDGKVPSGLRSYLLEISDDELNRLARGVRLYGFASCVVLAILAVLVEAGAF